MAYEAAHSFAQAALRRLGYRTDQRKFVFDVLEHTLSFPAGKARLLSNCHGQRNKALYEGGFSANEQLLDELILITQELQVAVSALGVPRT